MHTLPTPKSLPVDSEVRRLAVFMMAQISHKKRALAAAVDCALIFQGTLKNPFEFLLDSICNPVLIRMLKTLSLSADNTNSALANVVKAVEHASHTLEKLCTDYTNAVIAVDEYGAGKPATSLYPGLRISPSRITPAFRLDARTMQHREACLPLYFSGEDLSFKLAQHRNRVLREEPREDGQNVNVDNKVAQPTKIQQYQQVRSSQVDTASEPQKLLLQATRVGVNAAVPAIRRTTPPNVNSINKNRDASQKTDAIVSTPVNPFSIEQLGDLWMKKKTGPAAPKDQEVDMARNSTESPWSDMELAQKTEESKVRTKISNGQNPVRRFRENISNKQVTKTTATPATSGAASAPTASPSEQFRGIFPIKAGPAHTSALVKPIQLSKNVAAVKMSIYQDALAAGPSRPLKKAILAESVFQGSFEVGLSQQGRKVVCQGSPSTSPRQPPKSVGFMTFVGQDTSCDRPALQEKGKERRISTPRTPSPEFRIKNDTSVLQKHPMNDENENGLPVFSSAMTPPSTPPGRAPRQFGRRVDVDAVIPTRARLLIATTTVAQPEAASGREQQAEEELISRAAPSIARPVRRPLATRPVPKAISIHSSARERAQRPLSTSTWFKRNQIAVVRDGLHVQVARAPPPERDDALSPHLRRKFRTSPLTNPIYHVPSGRPHQHRPKAPQYFR
ncbi:hypothetical protein A4X09_0g103 [Tilletia walkeri]|uniref:Uncharacterized protein n=1 Tax=Tilletia walkeri TaxID=117179 RepID=A0A8X7T803_9BASI|nr:hypothetical protein A4X09_0g103 [Tilletia walkeri]